MKNGKEFLSRDEILQVDDVPTEEVDMTPFGWPGKVLVCGLTAAGKDALDNTTIVWEGGERRVSLENVRARLLQRCLVNQQRQPLFTEADILVLGTKSSKAIEHLARVAQRLSGMRDEDVKAIAKNSEPGQTAVSSDA